MGRIPRDWRIGGVVVGLLALGGLLGGSRAVSRADMSRPPDPALALASPHREGEPEGIGAGAPNTWSIQASYPIAISWQALAAHGGQLYSFGGVSDNVARADAYRYDPAANSWTAIRFLPRPLFGASAVSDGTVIYIVNGAGPANLYRYDPQTDTYTRLAPPTVPTHSQAAVYLGGKIYRIGGFAGAGPTASVEVYTIATNTWARAAPYLLPLSQIMTVAANGYIYAAGGFDAANQAVAKTARYDPATDTWDDAAVPDLPARRWGSASALVNGRWVLAGGKESGVPTNSVLAWDLNPATGWDSDLPALPRPRFRMVGAAMGQRFYSVGGCDTIECLHGTTDTQQYQAPTFWDVAPTDYFYTPVLYLVGHGVVSGYADGTFRPSANTTRGQLAKIVVLTEQWPLVTPAAPHFSDMPLSNPFYAFVETAVAHGVISGYSDGTFRPSADVTRGQLSKIIVGARGWPQVSPAAAHFADVPPGSPFYTFVETAVARGIISGYADHTFRPGNPATRGQIAKIVYNALQAGPGATRTPGAATPTARAASPTPRPPATATPQPPSATPTVTCAAPWQVVPSPNLGTSSTLRAVAGVAPNDVWAVGSYYNGVIDQVLIEHWDGTQWSVVATPYTGTGPAALFGVAAVAANDAWAVGYSETGTLVEHWNGTTWELDYAPPGNGLYDIMALSATNIWAVGASASGTLVEHWDGTQWSVVPSPNSPPTDNTLVGVSAVAADDIWAVGGNAPTLTEHWDGTRWSVVPGPNVGTLPTALLQVAAVAHNDVWAAGYYFDATDTGRTLIAHWNGVEWSIVPSPDPGEDFLSDIAAVGPHDVWAVGNTNSINTLVLHWNGSNWTISPSPSVGGNGVVLYGVGVVRAGDIWAVGGGNGQTLIEHYDCPGP